jgi:hypothetical protein
MLTADQSEIVCFREFQSPVKIKLNVDGSYGLSYWNAQNEWQSVGIITAERATQIMQHAEESFFRTTNKKTSQNAELIANPKHS